MMYVELTVIPVYSDPIGRIFYFLIYLDLILEQLSLLFLFFVRNGNLQLLNIYYMLDLLLRS